MPPFSTSSESSSKTSATADPTAPPHLQKVDRRQFLRQTFAASLALSTADFVSAPHRLAKSAGWGGLLPKSPESPKNLVCIQLVGGMDGLNTIVPYNEAEYYRARPHLSLNKEQLHRLDAEVGFHWEAEALAALYREQKLSIIQQVGADEGMRSHFRASQIWQLGTTSPSESKGWLGKYADQHHQKTGQLPQAMILDPAVEQTLHGTELEPHAFDLLARQDNLAFSAQLDQVAQQICRAKEPGQGNLLAVLALDGFDTHTRQTDHHPGRLAQLSRALFRFQRQLEAYEVDRNCLTLVYSEFGRRLWENDDQGTEHGAAGPLLLLGTSVRSGIVGSPFEIDFPSGDVKSAFDFRQVYATVIERWLGGNSLAILGGNFQQLEVL